MRRSWNVRSDNLLFEKVRFPPIADTRRRCDDIEVTEDWRLENLQMWPRLRGLRLIRKSYAVYRPGWDHDHCAACNKKLAAPGIEAADTVHEGYATASDYEWGADYEWVCVECFRDFKDYMGWKEA